MSITHSLFFSPEIARITKVHLTPRLGSHPSFSPESARALHKARNPASIFTRASFVIEALVSQNAITTPWAAAVCSSWNFSIFSQAVVVGGGELILDHIHRALKGPYWGNCRAVLNWLVFGQRTSTDALQNGYVVSHHQSMLYMFCSAISY